jgi:hypothetical protein
MVEGLFTRWNLGVAELPRDEAHPDIEVFSRTSVLRGGPYRGYVELARWRCDEPPGAHGTRGLRGFQQG